MMTWLSVHLVDILLILAIALLVFLAARSLILEKKAGRSSCGCGCSDCAMGSSCHKTKVQKSGL